MTTMHKLPPSVLEAVEIDEDDIMGEFRRFSGVYAFWLWNRAQAQGRVLRESSKLDSLVAEARETIRDTVDTKLTVDDLKAMIKLDKSVLAQQDVCDAAESEERRLAAVVEALRAKKDMLVSLGAQQRALAKGGGGLDLSE